MGTCYSAPGASGVDDADKPNISVRKPEENSPKRKLPSCKVVLLGDTSAGKTSLVQRFTRNHFDESQCATIGAAFTSHVVDFPDKRSIQMDIWDTAGQERYRTLAPLYYRNAAGAIIVFDLVDAASFESCKTWVADFREQRPPTTPVVLVGNKLDLQSERKISQEDAKEYADANDLMYIETSAKANLLVTNMFEMLASRVLERLGPSSPSRSSPPSRS